MFRLSAAIAGAKLYWRLIPLNWQDTVMPEPSRSSAESIARLMDRSIRLPGGFRIGLDGIIGLIPGIGDAATGAVSLLLLHQAHREGLPKSALYRMGGNIVLDTTLGAIPVAGDVFDFFWKANMRNLKIIEKHRETLARHTAPSQAQPTIRSRSGSAIEDRHPG